MWSAFPTTGDELVGEREGHCSCEVVMNKPLPEFSLMPVGALLGGVREGAFTSDLLLLFREVVGASSSSSKHDTTTTTAPLSSELFSWRRAGKNSECERDGASLLATDISVVSPSVVSSSSLMICWGGMSSEYDYLNDCWALMVDVTRPYDDDEKSDKDMKEKNTKKKTTPSQDSNQGSSDDEAFSSSSDEEDDDEGIASLPSPVSLKMQRILQLGEVPSPRYRHSAAYDSASKSMILWGGDSSEGPCACDTLYVGKLEVEKKDGASVEVSCTWRGVKVNCEGGATVIPRPRFSAKMTVIPPSSLTHAHQQTGIIFLLVVGGAAFITEEDGDGQLGAQFSLDEVGFLIVNTASETQEGGSDNDTAFWIPPKDGTSIIATSTTTDGGTSKDHGISSSSASGIPAVNGHELFLLPSTTQSSSPCVAILGGKDQHTGTDDIHLLSLVENAKGSTSSSAVVGINVLKIPAPMEIGIEGLSQAELNDVTREVKRSRPWPHWRYQGSSIPLQEEGVGEEGTEGTSQLCLFVGGQTRHPDPVVGYLFSPMGIR